MKLEFSVELSNEELAKELKTTEGIIIEEILNILRSYNIENPDKEDFRCIDEIVSLMEDNGYDCGPCHDF